MIPERLVTLSDGGACRIRPLNRDDEEQLGAYFLGLSEETKSLFGPHPFDRDTARSIVREDNPNVFRFVACSEGDDQIVGYFILFLDIGGNANRFLDLDREIACAIAPSVMDGLQNRGLGSEMMKFSMDTARRCGKQKMILAGGVQARNHRGIHFYRKHGFRYMGEFQTAVRNFDMIAEIPHT